VTPKKRKTKAEREAEKAAAHARALAQFKRRLAQEPRATGVVAVTATMIAKDACGDLDSPRVARIGDVWYANGDDLALYRNTSQAGVSQ